MTLRDVTPLIAHLQTQSYFAQLAPATVRRFAAEAQWREFAAGEVIVWEGETRPGLFFVQFGWVKVSKLSSGGREQVLRFVEAGETFNEVAVFIDQPSPATATALEAVGLWYIRQAMVQRLLREHPEAATHILATMAGRLLHLVSLVADLSLRSVVGRLAGLLLSDAQDGVLHRPRWYTQAELAARLGTVPDVVHRALRQLEGDGLIVVRRREIQLLDPAGLAKVADQ